MSLKHVNVKSYVIQKTVDVKLLEWYVLFTAMVKVSVNNARRQKLGDVSQKWQATKQIQLKGIKRSNI